jgi:hypothetical protein
VETVFQELTVSIRIFAESAALRLILICIGSDMGKVDIVRSPMEVENLVQSGLNVVNVVSKHNTKTN